MTTTGIYVLGSGRDPFDSTLIGGAVSSAGVELAAYRTADVPPLSPAAQKAIGDQVAALPEIHMTPNEAACHLWDTALHLQDPDTDAICVWDAPAQLTLIHQYLPEDQAAELDSLTYDSEPVGPLILDVKLLDRWFYPDRPGRRTIQTTAQHLGIPADGDLPPQGSATLLARVGEELLRRHHLDQFPPQALMLSQRSWHHESTDVLADWLHKQHRSSAHLDNYWPLRDRPDPIDDWAAVDDWLDGSGSPTEARDALRRIRRAQ